MSLSRVFQRAKFGRLPQRAETTPGQTLNVISWPMSRRTGLHCKLIPQTWCTASNHAIHLSAERVHASKNGLRSHHHAAPRVESSVKFDLHMGKAPALRAACA